MANRSGLPLDTVMGWLKTTSCCSRDAGNKEDTMRERMERRDFLRLGVVGSALGLGTSGLLSRWVSRGRRDSPATAGFTPDGMMVRVARVYLQEPRS